MFSTPNSPPKKAWTTTLASLAILSGSALAQNFTMQVTDSNPLGLGNFVPSLTDLDDSISGTIKGDFDYGLQAATLYNSNFFLTEDDEESEVYAIFSPWVNYSTDPEGGAEVKFTANYTPIIRCYLDNSDLNGVDQSGDMTLTFKGSKTEISLFTRYNELSATDRFTGDFVEGSLITAGIRGARQVAPRTAINGGWTAAMSDYGSSANEGAEIYTTYLGGIWQATERLGFGPTLRYTVSESDNIGTRDAYALMFDARYKVGERIWLSASLGPEFSETSGGAGTSDQSSVGLTGDITATYLINERWRWMTRLRSATVPSPSENNYVVNDYALSTILERQFTRCTVLGGLEFNLSEYEDVGSTLVPRGNEENFNVYVSYNRALFSERVGFNSTVRYAVNQGQTDWSQWLISAGLNVVF
jgi:hypothetical protein